MVSIELVSCICSRTFPMCFALARKRKAFSTSLHLNTVVFRGLMTPFLKSLSSKSFSYKGLVSKNQNRNISNSPEVFESAHHRAKPV